VKPKGRNDQNIAFAVALFLQTVKPPKNPAADPSKFLSSPKTNPRGPKLPINKTNKTPYQPKINPPKLAD
jgi:hypothetical protein